MTLSGKAPMSGTAATMIPALRRKRRLDCAHFSGSTSCCSYLVTLGPFLVLCSIFWKKSLLCVGLDLPSHQESTCACQACVATARLRVGLSASSVVCQARSDRALPD